MNKNKVCSGFTAGLNYGCVQTFATSVPSYATSATQKKKEAAAAGSKVRELSAKAAGLTG